MNLLFRKNERITPARGSVVMSRPILHRIRSAHKIRSALDRKSPVVTILLLVTVMLLAAIGQCWFNNCCAAGEDGGISGPGRLQAEGITFREAVKKGSSRNPALTELRAGVEQLERNLARIRTELNWQLDVNGVMTYGYSKDPLAGGNLERRRNLQFSLQGNKAFLSGLTLQPELTVAAPDYQPGPLDEMVNLTLDLEQRIYPRLPAEPEQEYRAVLVELTAARENLRWQEEVKKIDWLEQYLNLQRLRERIELAAGRVALAGERLEQLERQAELREAGENRLLTARIELRQRELNRLQTLSRLQEQRQALYQELGIAQGDLLLTGGEAVDLQAVEARVKELNELSGGILSQDAAGKLETAAEGLLELAVEHNPRLRANLRQQELARQRQEWSKLQEEPVFYGSGSYDYQTGEWKLGLGVNYKLLDGGRRVIDEQEETAELAALEREYRNIFKEEGLHLSGLLKQVKEEQLNLQVEKLALHKADLELESCRQQYSRGLVAEAELKERLLAREEAAVDYGAARDRLLISGLRLLQLLEAESIRY